MAEQKLLRWERVQLKLVETRVYEGSYELPVGWESWTDEELYTRICEGDWESDAVHTIVFVGERTIMRS